MLGRRAHAKDWREPRILKSWAGGILFDQCNLLTTSKTVQILEIHSYLVPCYYCGPFSSNLWPSLLWTSLKCWTSSSIYSGHYCLSSLCTLPWQSLLFAQLPFSSKPSAPQNLPTSTFPQVASFFLNISCWMSDKPFELNVPNLVSLSWFTPWLSWQIDCSCNARYLRDQHPKLSCPQQRYRNPFWLFLLLPQKTTHLILFILWLANSLWIHVLPCHSSGFCLAFGVWVLQRQSLSCATCFLFKLLLSSCAPVSHSYLSKCKATNIVLLLYFFNNFGDIYFKIKFQILSVVYNNSLRPHCLPSHLEPLALFNPHLPSFRVA